MGPSIQLVAIYPALINKRSEVVPPNNRSCANTFAVSWMGELSLTGLLISFMSVAGYPQSSRTESHRNVPALRQKGGADLSTCIHHRRRQAFSIRMYSVSGVPREIV